ncbi:MAG: SDR family NAD(P)-dependent oxidoreductase [Gammaproteobacteria bacterium]|nr:SDR family NAD(P)-dependent oxidoreductase [Gammaproteobacteria bacterium]
MEIKDSTIVITGGAQGLGKAIGLQMAASGANIALVDVNEAALEQAFNEFQQSNSQVKTYIANVVDEQQVDDLFSSIESDLGSISGLVNNAGILRDGLLVKAKDGVVSDRLSLQQWQSVIDVNLTGVFLCGRAAATKMIESGSNGVIINISSISRAGNAGQSNYAAAKAGVAALTVTWARELARYGIRCVGIAPGVFETEMVASMKPEAYDRIVGGVPLGRTGSLGELADTVAYILNNDYINGRIIELDGGLRL